MAGASFRLVYIFCLQLDTKYVYANIDKLYWKSHNSNLGNGAFARNKQFQYF